MDIVEEGSTVLGFLGVGKKGVGRQMEKKKKERTKKMINSEIDSHILELLIS